MPYRSDDLLTEVRRGGSLPSSDATGTADVDLLAHADAELRDTLVPLMLGVREEFYERVFDAAVVAGTAAYRINKRAALSRLNTVQWINADGTGVNLPRYEPKQVADLNLLTTAQGRPLGYYLEGSRVVLYPTPSGAGTLRVRAFVRPGRLALIAATGSLSIEDVDVITDVDGATSYVLTVGAHSYTASTPVDVVSGTPSFEYLALDALPGSVSAGVSVTIAAAAFSTAPAIGDYVCAPDTSPYVQLPVEFQPALVELTIARVLRAQGDRSEADSHAKEAQRLVQIGIEALTPRVTTADRKILGGPHYRSRSYFGGRY